VRVLVVDHYDSFTWNLAHAIAAVTGALPRVVQHDDPALARWDWASVDAVVLSPGPGSPTCAADVRHSHCAIRPGLPLLGVCLGMQLLAHRSGARVARAPAPRHGRPSPVTHTGEGIFAGIPSPFTVIRYHSLACDALPDSLEPTAWAGDDGVLMGLRHRVEPWWGVQFHPESIATEHGDRLIGNFLALAAERGDKRPSRHAPPPAPAAVANPTAPARPPDEADRAPWDRPPPLLLHSTTPGVPDPATLFAERFRASARVWLDGAAEGSRWSILGDTSGPLGYLVRYHAGGAMQLQAREHIAARNVGLWDFLRGRLAPGWGAELDLPFRLGFVGAFGYELRADLGSPVAAPGELPDAELLYLDRAVVIDHVARRTWVLALDHPENRRWLAEMSAVCTAAVASDAARGEGSRSVAPGALGGAGPPAPPRLTEGAAWRHEHDVHRDHIRACLAYIAAGETYELCLTNAVSVPMIGDPLDAFRLLRQVNPAPFAAFLQVSERALLSSSPERFLSVRRGRVVTEPIKGTRRRLADPDADADARRALAASEKDRAENLMIVDLARNDLGRVCRPGTVTVPTLFGVRSFARVHQMVSTVRGELRDGLGAIDAIEAAFPPGSMTGAPKLRSMALLEALEGAPRGLYSGAIGYLSLCSDADLSVVIRAAHVRSGVATVGVGGAIVALSHPDEEVAEMELKAEGVLDALRPFRGG
jgi:para-aminobenzoate synthetase